MTHVAGQQREHRGETRKRRNRAAIAASLVAHVVVLAIIGVNVPRPVYREPPPTQTANIWLMPRLTPQQHKPAEPATARSAPRLISTPKPQPPAQRPSPIQSASVPAPGRPAPAEAQPGPPPNAGADGSQGVREALRTTVGCDADQVVHLTPTERARCNQSMGEMAKKQAPFDGIDPLKRGRFDAQADADERRRAARLVPPVSPVDCSLYPSCLPPSAIKHVPF